VLCEWGAQNSVINLHKSSYFCYRTRVTVVHEGAELGKKEKTYNNVNITAYIRHLDRTVHEFVRFVCSHSSIYSFFPLFLHIFTYLRSFFFYSKKFRTQFLLLCIFSLLNRNSYIIITITCSYSFYNDVNHYFILPRFSLFNRFINLFM
jgi:hypothetical protein